MTLPHRRRPAACPQDDGVGRAILFGYSRGMTAKWNSKKEKHEIFRKKYRHRFSFCLDKPGSFYRLRFWSGFTPLYARHFWHSDWRAFLSNLGPAFLPHVFILGPRDESRWHLFLRQNESRSQNRGPSCRRLG